MTTKKRLNTYVHVDGRAYGPADDIPPEIAEKITAPGVWTGEAVPLELEAEAAVKRVQELVAQLPPEHRAVLQQQLAGAGTPVVVPPVSDPAGSDPAGDNPPASTPQGPAPAGASTEQKPAARSVPRTAKS